MRPEQRVIMRLPLDELWDRQGPVQETCCTGTIDKQAIAELLRLGPVRFVIADVGKPPIWIASEECFEFWRREVKAHLMDPESDGFYLDAYPDQYAYLARRWQVSHNLPVIVLEKHH